MFIGMKLRNLSDLVWTVERFVVCGDNYETSAVAHVVMSTCNRVNDKIEQTFGLPLADHWQIEDGTAPIWLKQRAEKDLEIIRLRNQVENLQEVNDTLNESNKQLAKNCPEPTNPTRRYIVQIDGSRGLTYACRVQGHSFYGQPAYAARFNNRMHAERLAKALMSCSWCENALVIETQGDRFRLVYDRKIQNANAGDIVQ